jgi:hypothetical protein
VDAHAHLKADFSYQIATYSETAEQSVRYVSRERAERLLYSGAHLRQKTSGATLAHRANVLMSE